jgi:hypothetical protein
LKPFVVFWSLEKSLQLLPEAKVCGSLNCKTEENT